LNGLAFRLHVSWRKGGTGKNKDWEARLHGGRKYWKEQNGEHIVREICLGQSLQFPSL